MREWERVGKAEQTKSTKEQNVYHVGKKPEINIKIPEF